MKQLLNVKMYNALNAKRFSCNLAIGRYSITQYAEMIGIINKDESPEKNLRGMKKRLDMHFGMCYRMFNDQVANIALGDVTLRKRKEEKNGKL